MTALFRRLLAAHRFYQAQHQHHMNKMRLAGVRRERLAGLDEVRKELIMAQIESMIDLDAPGRAAAACGPRPPGGAMRAVGQAFLNWRAGHAIGHAVRLALLKAEITKLTRKTS